MKQHTEAQTTPYARCYELAFQIQKINQRKINRLVAPCEREEFIDQHAATELANLIYERIVRKNEQTFA